MDEFAQMLLDVDPQFQTTYKSEWVLLKNFDRAFWLKFQKYDTAKEFTPLYKENDEKKKELACPFGDPSQTMSMIGMEHK